jgi:serine/threonine protein kinase
MELVGGIKITDFCDQNNLTTRQRLDLFIQICRAIQHAHQKGVIHRDIKPSNVLVAKQDGVPVPKVIDFGIAKATQGRLTDETLFTAFEQFLGTPAYMSPEQAQLGGIDVDTRSDIYSLGVLLYELLTGTTPFDTKELVAAGLDEMRRTIREVEPVKPSTRLTQDLVAADVRRRSSKSESEESASSPRRLPTKELIHSVRGDMLVFGQNLRTWSDGEGQLGRAAEAWSGKNDNGDFVRLIKYSWQNPHPEAEVQTIDFMASRTDSSPILFALTAEQ